MSRFIVIEKQNYEMPTIITDDEGYPKIFSTEDDAEKEVEDCQDGQIVEI